MLNRIREANEWVWLVLFLGTWLFGILGTPLFLKYVVRMKTFMASRHALECPGIVLIWLFGYGPMQLVGYGFANRQPHSRSHVVLLLTLQYVLGAPNVCLGVYMQTKLDVPWEFIYPYAIQNFLMLCAVYLNLSWNVNRVARRSAVLDITRSSSDSGSVL